MAHQDPPQIPDEIVVITTQTGKARLRADLIESGVWREFVDTLARAQVPGASRLRLGETSVRVLPDADENEIDDLRTVEDNLRAADFMLGIVRQYTEDPSTVVFASIAGGRKTMSALLFSCMSLLGRAGDKIFHVLTNPEAVSLKPTFLFPREGTTHEFVEKGMARKIDAATVAIELFEVPFVRMRGWYQEKFKKIPPSYRSLVSQVQVLASESYPKLKIDVWNGQVWVDGVEANLSPTEFAVLILSAQKIDSDRQWDCLCETHQFRGSGVGCSKCAWLSSFQAGSRFNPDSVRDELAKVRSSLRKKLSQVGFHAVDSLIPSQKPRRPVTFPVERIDCLNVSRLRDVCGCLFPEKRA